VLNSPPALAVTDAAIVAAKADASIVVVRADRTSRGDAAACVESLRRAGSRVIGTVLLDDPYVKNARVPRRWLRGIATSSEAPSEAT
jgi:Mrp family chromosome partitioning ATPase